MLYVNPMVGLSEARSQSVIRGSSGRQKLALQEYEHYFLFSLLQEMQKTVPQSELFGSGPELGYYQDIMNDTLSGEMAKSGQMGIAKMMAEQMRIADMQSSLVKQAPTAPGVQALVK